MSQGAGFFVQGDIKGGNTMSTESARLLTQAGRFAAALALLAPGVSLATPQDLAIERAGPPVPTPRSQPCEVELFHHESSTGFPESFTFVPPAACAPPWAKVVLSMDLSGTRNNGNGVVLALKDVTLFMAPIPGTEQTARWRVERDLTDYSALFKTPGSGQFSALYWGTEPFTASSSATLRFYPPTAAQPAPRVPDAVYSTYTALIPPEFDTGDRSGGIKPLSALPHNIERAYLDVTANDDAFWYSCLPRSVLDAHPSLKNNAGLGLTPRGVWPIYQACTPHSYADTGVTVDGTPAGVAPSLPWLPTDFSINTGVLSRSPFWHALDAPTDSAQSLDFLPWRVDLTPFAAILNEAGTHRIVLHTRDHRNSREAFSFTPANANLLVYLDRGRARLPGAVTYNSLPTTRPEPKVTPQFTQDGNLLTGQVETDLDRNFEICGYVDTSHGRVRTTVIQRSRFNNLQRFRVKDSPYGSDAEEHYRQHLTLTSTVEATSRRTRNGVVLSEDRHTASYPLDVNFFGRGRWTDWYGDEPGEYDLVLFGGTVSANQQRREDASHYRKGLPVYRTHLREAFYGTHAVDPYTEADSNWHAAHTFAFDDNSGSCYQKAVTTRHGALDDTTTGVGCPGGQNHVRWFAHPDGSATGMAWQRP
jgi:hypothetical protein